SERALHSPCRSIGRETARSGFLRLKTISPGTRYVRRVLAMKFVRSCVTKVPVVCYGIMRCYLFESGQGSIHQVSASGVGNAYLTKCAGHVGPPVALPVDVRAGPNAS